MDTVCIFLLYNGDKGAVDATYQLILLYVLTSWPPLPQMKAFTMFAEPLAAVAKALFFLLSVFDATAAGGGAAGGTGCACEASGGAAAIELLRLGDGVSLITVAMSSTYLPSSSVPSQRSTYAWLSKPNNCSVTVPSFVLAFNSWNCSVVNASLCLSLPDSAFMPSKAAAFIEKQRVWPCAKHEQEFQHKWLDFLCDIQKRNRHFGHLVKNCRFSRRHQIHLHLNLGTNSTTVAHKTMRIHYALVARAGQPICRGCRVAHQGKGCSFLDCGRCRAWGVSEILNILSLVFLIPCFLIAGVYCTTTLQPPLNFTYYSRTHAFRYGRQNKNPALTRIELTTST